MRLGVFSVLDLYDASPEGGAARRVDEAIELAVWADRLGFDSFWVGEHHFQSAGVSPAPPVLLAAIARETWRIRLGSLVAVLPLHEGRALAEEYALLDVLAQGRLEIGIGSGYSPLEFYGFGLDPAARRSAFDRVRSEFLLALGGESWAAPGAPESRVALNVRPVQRPTPPLWTAAVRQEAVRAVGSRGEGLALIPYASLSRVEELRGLVREYREALPLGAEPRVLAAVHLYLGDDLELAERALDRFLETRPAPDSPAFRDRLRSTPELGTARGLRERGLAVLGDPHNGASMMATFEQCGVTDLAAIVDFGGLPLDAAVDTLRAWARSVVPVERAKQGGSPRSRLTPDGPHLTAGR